MKITFTFNPSTLVRPRPMRLIRGKGRYAIPMDSLYQPVHDFLASKGGNYPFSMIDLLHAAAVKMLGFPAATRRNRTMFAVGGLYLSLDPEHTDLKIQNTFGDFTSGFSHQFGVALSIMTMSEAFGISWDQLTPIPIAGKRVLDYQAQIPGGNCWLQLEAKGVTSDASRTSARSSAYRKKLVRPKNINSAKRLFPDPTAMIGVIAQAARTDSGRGVIEIIDPDFEIDPRTRRPENQQAGRYLHYAGVARFAGLENVAQIFIQRASALVRNQRDFLKVQDIDVLDEAAFQADARTIVGVQWRLGNSEEESTDIWFYQGFDLDYLRQILIENEFPRSYPYHMDRPKILDELVQQIESYLPDGSFFGIGTGPRPDLLIVDYRKLERDTGSIVRLKIEGAA